MRHMFPHFHEPWQFFVLSLNQIIYYKPTQYIVSEIFPVKHVSKPPHIKFLIPTNGEET